MSSDQQTEIPQKQQAFEENEEKKVTAKPVLNERDAALLREAERTQFRINKKAQKLERGRQRDMKNANVQ